MRDAGLSPVGETLFSSWTEGWGRNAAMLLLRQHPEIDGIVCASDQIARGVLDTLRDLGRSVPDDVAVIGYDNWQVLATNARPELTTIDNNLEELGRRAARRIFDAIDGEPLAGTVESLPVRLVVRGSTIALR